MNDPDHPPGDGKPYFPIDVYKDWLRRNLGTPEQQERYRQAVAWYDSWRSQSAQKGQKPLKFEEYDDPLLPF